ncbi:MAG: biosynthetic-type acetolactate synthase large subunit [Lachnospiraceae bacterium]|nr:biosynthetic-type acetolactate synthase large subunit [Lachnospiraceae bacterium]
MIGAEAIIKCLEAEDVKYVFGYPGVAICPFYNSILESDIKTVLVRTEQSAAHAASGLARITGKPGVCAVTSGPGATNIITGVATAYADSIPLIVITGQVKTDLIGSDVFQEADITGAVESFVKYSYLVKKAEDLPRIFKEAFHIASSGRKGPVLIDIPIDVQNDNIKNFKYPESVNLRTYKPTVKGNASQIKKVIKELAKADKPIMCIGGGVQLGQADDEVIKFAEKHNIPMVTTMMGIGTIPTDHPLYFGMVGNNGKPYANKAMNESDCVMMVGARVADRAISQPDLITKDKVLIHIDVDPAEIGKNAVSSIPLVGDCEAIFEDLNKEDFSSDTSKWLKALEGFKKELKIVRKPNKKYVDPQNFIETLTDKLKDDAIYIADVGQNQIFSCAYAKIKKGKFLTSGGMGTMGYSIPASLGAKLAAPKRQVVCVCGDGSFQMSMCELATFVQHGVQAKIIVFNNNFLGMVREYQHYSYKDNYSMVSLDGSPDLEKLVKAYGFDYLRLKTAKGLSEIIDKFLEDKNNCLLEVMIDPMDLVK